MRCPFCHPEASRVIWEGELARALWDAFPLSEGHALVVPKRHVASWFEATAAEQAEMLAGLERARLAVLARCAPDGFNIGVNDGAAAGQTVPHLHAHLVPRFHGDVADPRGGVRWVLPARARYWEADDS
jgi:diadenosine tetraphosphate (Ap4A) HIT family hydrolase